MCTRFYIDISDKELQDIVSSAAGSALARRFLVAGDPLNRSGEIFPTNVTAVIASSRSGRRSVFPMKWGYEMRGSQSGARRVSTLMNARTETAGSKPTFRDSWRAHRCIIPASYYFEWDAEKRKYAIQPKGCCITWLCGLYRIEDGFPHFVVLTRQPSDDISFIHDRMPLILPESKINAWIDPKVDAGSLIPHSLSEVYYERAI